MNEGEFYFVSPNFYTVFPCEYYMDDKPSVAGQPHNRAYCVAYQEGNINWLVPISSKIEKFTAIYDTEISRGKKCDYIVFGKVLGYNKAFSIRNMIPITQQYILNQYISKNNSVLISISLLNELRNKTKLILNLIRTGIFHTKIPVLEIENSLKQNSYS